jgi:hypothetical protein
VGSGGPVPRQNSVQIATVEANAAVGESENQRQKWLELCRLAAKENDPDKLTTLVTEIATLMQSTGYPVKKASSVTKNPTKKATSRC